MSEAQTMNSKPSNKSEIYKQATQGRSIFELSAANRRASAQRVDGTDPDSLSDIPAHLLRTEAPGLPEVSEL